MTFDVQNYLKNQKNEVGQALKGYFAALGPDQSPLYEAMAYSVFAGGKRIRPILCLATAELLDFAVEKAIPLACALELIHTYSLIHDDLPGMDNDALRRGQPTCHMKFGEATAILAGDALLTWAFEIVAEAGLKEEKTEQWLFLVKELSNSAGPFGMVEGQMQDILAGEKEKLPTQMGLECIHRNKTGKLIEISINSIPIIHPLNDVFISALHVFSAKIGLAFQVMDDVLDEIGDPQTLGKTTGKDARLGKATYPSFLGIENAKKYAEQLVTDAIAALSVFDIEKRVPLEEIARYIVARDV